MSNEGELLDVIADLRREREALHACLTETVEMVWSYGRASLPKVDESGRRRAVEQLNREMQIIYRALGMEEKARGIALPPACYDKFDIKAPKAGHPTHP